MEFPDLKPLDAAALRLLRIDYLQLMDAHRKSIQPKDAPTYQECVDRKNAVNEELRSRGENITASGISTPESKAKAQKIGASLNIAEINAELKAKDEENQRLREKLKAAGIAIAFVAIMVGFGWAVFTHGLRPVLQALAGSGFMVFGANALYDLGRQAFMTGDIDMSTDDIVVLLVDAALYTPNLSTDDFHADIAGGAIIATSNPLSSKTVAAGVFDAADELLASVPAGQQGDYLILVQDTGVSATSRLIGRIDTGTNLPVTPNGGDINIAWSAGASKIFKL